MTILVAIQEAGLPLRFKDAVWRPWVNCKSVDETAFLAVHRFVREAGHMNHAAEHPFLSFDVYLFDARAPRGATGQPESVEFRRFNFYPRQESAA